MARLIELLLAGALLITAAELDHPSGNRTTPPTLNAVSPIGIARGTTIEMTVEGLNLARASAIYFSEPGITGKILRVKELPDQPDIRLGSNGTPSTIDVGPLPPRNQVTVEVDVAPTAEIGPVGFRLQTPLGTSPEGKFLIEPYYGESPDMEPNDTPENAFECYLPTILTGTISKPGDLDYYKIRAKAGEQLVFENGAGLIGSTLNPVIAILSEDQSVLREFGTDGGMDAVQFAYKFEKAGTYYVRVSDYQQSGKGGNFYRIKIGNFPLVASAYPLGLEAGKPRSIALKGWNLGASALKVQATAGNDDSTLALRPNHSFNELKLAVGQEPEVDVTGQPMQPVSVPVTMNGHMAVAGHTFRFHAQQGHRYIIDVNARRLGSDLDSLVEVLDANGKPIERATVRAVSETFTTLSERDSVTASIRIQNGNDLKPGDYVMIGNEIIRLDALPKGPDDDAVFERFGGQRLAYFDTSTEAHAVDKPVYKVQIHPPGVKFSANGLPVVHLYYQNDDGGPGWGKDSLVHFTAPAAADYVVRIRDIRGLGGANYPYRLTIREPRPDFRLTVGNRNPNVPVGACVASNVTAMRLDEFDGPIDVTVEDLPTGLHAAPGVIAPGQVSTTVLICADPAAHLDRAAPLKIAGRAQHLFHIANPEDKLKLISLMPKPDVMMTAETKQVTVEQGGEAEVTVQVARQNDFRGRVPVDVRNLPPQVLVSDVGLNGVLINENETRRSFTIRALAGAQPMEQLIYVGGIVETRSNLPSTYAAPQAILLKVVAK
ncbi:MAG: hypothetical protein ACR2NN_16035 [Bryobacteraceae bacterium]